MLTNVVDNAIKYTTGAGTQIHIATDGAATEECEPGGCAAFEIILPLSSELHGAAVL